MRIRKMKLGIPRMIIGTLIMNLGIRKMKLGMLIIILGTPRMNLGTLRIIIGMPGMKLGTLIINLSTSRMNVGIRKMKLRSPQMDLRVMKMNYCIQNFMFHILKIILKKQISSSCPLQRGYEMLKWIFIFLLFKNIFFLNIHHLQEKENFLSR
ncbi:MAG: hypothetical protein V4677_07495 [Bacteroidota bacterium]